MKRSTDNRRSPAEIKADLQSHYGGLADKKPDGHAARKFIHKAYESYSVRDGDSVEYLERKYGIGSDADGQHRREDSE